MSSRAKTSEHDLDQLSSVFKLLGDKTRLHILLLLTQGERNVTSLCEQLDLPQPTVSHHLSLLRLHNVIANRRRGKQIFYTIDPSVDVNDPTSMRICLDRFNVEIGAKAARREAARAAAD